jgi:hypothetical protein
MENLIFDDNLTDPNFNASFLNTIAGDLVDIGRDFLDLEDEEEPEMDHVSFGGLKFLNFEFFDKKTKNLPGFEGFAPRYTLVTRLRNIQETKLNTSALFLIIVSIILDNNLRTHGKRWRSAWADSFLKLSLVRMT